MKKFIYKGIEFEPILRLPKNYDFCKISLYTSNEKRIKGFTHKDFYKKAKENNCDDYDLFRENITNSIVIVANNGYFNFYNQELFKKNDIIYKLD